MRIRLFSLITLGGLTMTSLSAQVLFSEDFDGIGGPTAGGAGTYVFPSGWLLRNVDNGTPDAQVAYVNEAWERREDFRFNVGDSAAFSTSWIGPAGTVDDWMWTPPVTLTDNAVLRWRAVAYDPDFSDGYEVRLMAAPDVPTGGTGVLGNQVDASLLLTTITAENSTWTDRSVDLADHAGQTVRIGFRNHSNDKFLLLIDDVVIERLLEVDAQMLAVDLPSRYTSTPLSQAAPITLQGSMRNNGTTALSDAAAQVDVLRDGTTVFSQSSTPQASLAPGASMDWAVPGYVPDAAGEYTVRYIARQASGTDQAPLNDTLYTAFTVSDSVYARDTGVLSGSLGIGAGNGGYLGQSFELVAADTLTSVLVAYSRGYVGRQAAVVIWDMAGGSPNAIVAGTDTVLYPSDEAFVAQLPIPDGGVLLPAGMYAVTAVEFDSTLALGLTTDIFTTGTTWVDWPSSPLPGWGHNEDFGAAFAKSYVLRPIFGHVCAGYMLQASSTPATCATCTDGSVTATVSGDHGEVTYAWDPAIGEGPSITDLAHGIYTVTATDALGCAASAQVAVAFDTCGVFTADLFTSAASCGTCPTARRGWW